jgi:outer membrane protein assembly factor BamA
MPFGKLTFNILVLLGLLVFSGDDLQAQKDTLKTKHILFFPVISRSIETSWSFGVAGSSTFHLAKYDSLTRTSNLQSVVLYSLKKQFVAAINGSIYTKGEEYILHEQLSYSSFPDKFWGLGNNSADQVVEDYTFRQFYIYLHLMRNLGNNLFAGILFEYQNVMEVDYIKGGLFDQQNIAGRNPYKVSGLGMSFTYDNRNDAFAPDKGYFAQFYFNHFDRSFGSDYNYTNFIVDLRKYFRIYKKQVLALQAYSFTNAGDEVPLRSLGSIGGANMMRGFYAGRYRDKQELIIQSEYRMPINKRFSAVAFYSLGDVGKTIQDYSLNDVKYAYGAGLRVSLNKSEKLNLRLDYGIGQGNNNSGFYLQLGEAF